MITLDFSLSSKKNGGNISAFSYSHSLHELVGTWHAQVAGGNFKAGASISFSGVMSGGIITHAYKDSSGLWHVEGKDAGVKLMKSTPDISDIPTGNAKTVIQYLASFCGLSLTMNSNGLSGFNVRSVVSASTCAEAILELAMLSGFVAFINSSGRLVVQAPVSTAPEFENVVDDSDTDIDLDGYATQVLVTLTRRKWPDNSGDTSSGEGEIVYSGSTPSTSPERVTKRGTFSNGSYSVTTLEPFGVIADAQTSITDNGITISTSESHQYDYKHKIIWRDNQEYVLFAFIEKGYTFTRTAEGLYNGTIEYETADGGHVSSNNPAFSEITTETLTRDFSASEVSIGIPDDWQGSINMVSKETITRSTSRTGFIPQDSNLPAYAPPYDSRIIRTYKRENGGKGLFCEETELSYEARQVGSIAPVKLNGQNIPHFLQSSSLAIQTHSVPQWVQVQKHSSYYEQYDNEGNCLVSTHSEYSDDGSKWLMENSLTSTGDNNMDAYQATYAAFSQNSKGLQVSIGSSVLTSAWQFIELQGRMKSHVTDSDIQTAALGNVSDWYDNGRYVRQSVCPHYNASSKSCNVYLLDNPDTSACNRFRGTLQWASCSRAVAALNLARAEDISQVEAPIIGTASAKSSVSKNPDVGYRRDVYVDELLTDEQAQSIADTIAANILAVKGSKGIRKTVTVPYNTTFQPNGYIVEVSHNWESLLSTVTFRDSGTIPDCLVSQSVAGIAAFVSARDTARLNVPKYGAVVEFSSGYVSVRIGDSVFSCTTKLSNLAQGDIVLVVFPAGNKLRGQVISRL